MQMPTKIGKGSNQILADMKNDHEKKLQEKEWLEF